MLPRRPPTPSEPRWKRWGRWLGPPDSWRRIVVTGATAGVTLAFVAALIAGLVGIGGGGGSLQKKTPTVAPIDGGVIDTEPPPIDTEVPIDTPVEVPTEEPTATEEFIEPTPTEEFVEPTPTLPEEITPEVTPPGEG